MCLLAALLLAQLPCYGMDSCGASGTVPKEVKSDFLSKCIVERLIHVENDILNMKYKYTINL